MKKIVRKLSALALLLTCSIGIWAQTSGTTVRFKNVDTGLYLQANASGNATINTLDASSSAQKFLIEDAGDGKYYLKSTVNGQVLYLNQDSYNVTATSSTGDSNKMGIHYVEDGVYSISTTYGGDCTYFGTDGTDDSSPVYSNKDVSANRGKWNIEELTVSIIYEYTYGNEVRYTETLKAGESDMSLPTPTLNMFGVKYDAPAGAVLDGNTIQIPISYDFPFVVADSYANVDTWYTLAVKTDKYLLNYAEGQTCIAPNGTVLPETGTDAYLWAFVGDPFDGFEIVNKAAGSTKVLSNPKDGVEHDYDRYPLMKTKTDLTTNDVCEYSLQASSYVDDGFFIGYDNGNKYVYMNNRWNWDDNAYRLAYWDDGADEGSTFSVTLAETSRQREITYVYKCNDIEVSRETLTAFAGDAYPTPNLPYGYAVSGNLPSGTVTVTETIIINMEESLPFEYADSYANISKWYTVSFHMDIYRGYMNYSDSDGLTCTTENETENINYMWAFVGNPIDGFQIYNMAAGNSVALDSSEPCGLSAEGTTCKWKVYPSSATDDGFCIKVEGQDYANLQGSSLMRWSANDAGSTAQVYAATPKRIVTTTDYGYATLFVNYPVAIPTGVEAHYVTVDGDVATLNEIEGVIPANTGVVVKGAASTEYQFEYTATAATTDVSDNKMVGYIVDTDITGDDAISYYAVNYKTVNSEKVPGFFAPKGANSPTGSFTAKGGKAYLKVEGAAGSSIVMRFGDATMVESLKADADAAIYDLTGRRVAQPERGIYIVNGKKMFFK